MPPQGARAEVRGHAGVERGGAGVFVTDLLLDEARIPAVLDQVGDVGPAEGVEVEPVVQAEGFAVGDEAGVEPLAADPQSALGGPGRRVVVGAEQRADLGEPLVQDIRCPVEDGQHPAAFGRRALLGLAEPDLAAAVLAELAAVRVAAEVGGVEHPCLVAPCPEGISGLEQRRVAEGGKPALAAEGPDAGDLVVAVREEGVQLGLGERALLGVRLVILDVHRGVPLVHHLHRVGPEPLFAGGRPLVERIGDEVAERPHGLRIRADRGALQISQRTQVTEPFVDHRRRPEPGVGVHVGGERLDRVLPTLHRRPGKIPRELLVGEPRQHCREDLLFRPQQRDPVDQMQPRRPRYRPVEPHCFTTLRNSHQMRENRILCESRVEAQVSPLRGPQRGPRRRYRRHQRPAQDRRSAA